LGDLVALGEIRIEVVLAGEPVSGPDSAIQGQPGPNGELDGVAVQNRQAAGETQTGGTGLAVRRHPEPGATATEQLGLREQLGMNLQADDRFIRGHKRRRVSSQGLDSFSRRSRSRRMASRPASKASVRTPFFSS